MQLYALDDNIPILATEALKQKNYQCPECLNSVRLRGGFHRQFHFYHLRWHPSCRQHQKSLPHLQLQLHLKSLIPSSSLEKPFPDIGRIADVAWDEKRLVFEVQCSPISHEEAKTRSEDYARAGYTVVWILHDKRFNKNNLSSAENFLRTGLCYFARGTEIYDQFDIVQNARRVFRGPRLPIDPTLPIDRPSLKNSLQTRSSPIAFHGDLFDRAAKDPQNIHMKRLEKRFTRHRRISFTRWYLLFFHAVLEKFSA